MNTIYFKFTFTLIFSLLILSCSDDNNDFITPVEGERYIEHVFEEYDVEENVQYGSNTNVSGNEISLKMDIYQPKVDNLDERPLVILAPGGAFVFLWKPDMETIAEDLVKSGYVVAIIQYRVYGQIGFPPESIYPDLLVHATQDMKAAIRFFKKDAANENKYKVNPNQIICGGHSAGAITAIQSAYMSDNDDFEDFIGEAIKRNGGLEGNSGNQGYSSSFAAVINLAGAIYNEDWIDAEEAPMFAVHGTNDDVVPYDEGEFFSGVVDFDTYGSKKIIERMDEIGIPTGFITIENGDHDSPIEDYFNYNLEMKQFLYEYVSSTIN